MSGKSRALAALNNEIPQCIPVMPHWWGVYKFQHAGACKGPADEFRGWELFGEGLAAVDSAFVESFQPDILHLSTGAWKRQSGDETRAQARRELRPAVMELRSKRAIDEYVQATTPTEGEYEAWGIFSHVPLLMRKYGQEKLILLNDGNPVCGVFENNGPAGDFQESLIATVEHPENLAYLIFRLYEAALVRMRVLARTGVHGFIGSETCVSCDIMSPQTIRDLVLPALRMFYARINQMGMLPIAYYLGEILPILDDIAGIGIKALMIEEPKKGFRLDAVDIYRRLDGRVALFGNLDSVWMLLHGSVEDVVRETRRQCEGAAKGGFVMACGSPLCYDTPGENIRAMIDTAHEYCMHG